VRGGHVSVRDVALTGKYVDDRISANARLDRIASINTGATLGDYTINTGSTQGRSCPLQDPAATLRPVPRTYTTPEVAEAVGVSGQTLRRWAREGLLPVPEKIHRGGRGSGSAWPETTIEQARWVLAQLNSNRTIAQVLEGIRAGEYPPQSG
jgi:predicted DNA-binding transcriptional regulator AlpA